MPCQSDTPDCHAPHCCCDDEDDVLLTEKPHAPGVLKYFTKSGNQVRLIEPASPYMGQPMWTVERVDGGSKGKQMDCPQHALVDRLI